MELANSMSKHDLGIGAVLALLISAFLIPTLANTGFYNKFPSLYIYIFLFGLFPVLVIAGLYVASFIGKKVEILWQFTKFASVGVLNTAIDFGIFNTLIYLTQINAKSGIVFINFVSFSVAVINSYFWNRRWVFKDSQKGDFITFIAVTLVGLAINTSIVFLITTFVSPVLVQNKAQWANIAKALATIGSLMWNFVGYRLIVFKK